MDFNRRGCKNALVEYTNTQKEEKTVIQHCFFVP